MKILWLCNVPIFVTGEKKSSTRGGWMEGLMNSVYEELDLFVLYPSDKCTHEKRGKVEYYSFLKNETRDIFEKIIKEITPDIIHIWGTEYKHSADMVEVAVNNGILNRVVVNIQGILGVYHPLYDAGIPKKYCGVRNLVEILDGDYVAKSQRGMAQRAQYEKYVFKNVENVIGRTFWDKTIAKQYNPYVKYFFMNETLRKEFYGAKEWAYEDCEKYSIFVSQGSNPIKGLHMVLKAINIVKAHYKDVHLYVTGDDFRNPRFNNPLIKKLQFVFSRRLFMGSYGIYIDDLINEYGLEENVSFLGELNVNEMVERLQKSNVVVSASIIENESNLVSEAHILGVPVVASFVGGVTGRIIHGENGFFYPYNEPDILAGYLMEIFQMREKVSIMAHSGVEFSKRISDPMENKKQLLRIYDEILNA